MLVLAFGPRLPVRAGDRRPQPEQDAVVSTVWWSTCEQLGGQSVEVDLVMQAELAM